LDREKETGTEISKNAIIQKEIILPEESEVAVVVDT